MAESELTNSSNLCDLDLGPRCVVVYKELFFCMARESRVRFFQIKGGRSYTMMWFAWW